MIAVVGLAFEFSFRLVGWGDLLLGLGGWWLGLVRFLMWWDQVGGSR